MEKQRKPRKKKQKPLDTTLEKIAGTSHKVEIRDGVVVVVPEDLELDSKDPRNELVGTIKDEELEVNKVQGIITIRKTYDNEVQYVVDDQSQLLSQQKAREVRAENEKNQQEASADLKPESYKGAVVVESESYKDLIDVLNYQDSGKMPK